jgi:hypothetical protein
VIIVGSQAILGTYREEQLPREATMSVEVDVLPMGDDARQIERHGDVIEAAAGEFTPFDEAHGFHIDAVGPDTAVLPDGWRDRLVRVQNPNTAGPSGAPQFIGWCLDREDLCVAKLCAHREKDLNFVGALIAHGLVRTEVMRDRLQQVPHEHARAAEAALSWLASQPPFRS